MTTEAAAGIDQATASRFAMYQLLADALEFPVEAFHEAVRSGVLRENTRAAADGLPFAIDTAAVDGLVTDEDYIEFQGAYIRLFDVGVVRPPCPLYGGEWGRARRSTMEDALRFYEFFGMKMDEGARELPDHVTVELEFMQVLAYTEGTARAQGADALPFVRAERDFLARHPGKWWPLLRRKIGDQQPSPFYDALTAVTDSFIAGDLAYLRALTAAA